MRLKMLPFLGKIQLPATNDWWTCILKQADPWQLYCSDLESNSFLPLLLISCHNYHFSSFFLERGRKDLLLHIQAIMSPPYKTGVLQSLWSASDLKMALQNDSATVWASSLNFGETELLHLQLKLREEAQHFQELGTLEINSAVTVQNH